MSALPRAFVSLSHYSLRKRLRRSKTSQVPAIVVAVDAGDLIGLWQFCGYATAKGIVRPSFGSPQGQLHEFLFFDADGTFFFAKFPLDTSLSWDPDSSRFVAAEGGILAHGTWTLDGNRLVESMHTEGSDVAQPNVLTLDELTSDRLIVVEPTRTSGETLRVAYDRDDIERFPAPPLVVDMPVNAREDGLARIQQAQQHIAILIEAGRFNSAHRLSQQTVRDSTRVFGETHPNTAACLVTLGACLSKVHDTDAAIDVLEQAYRLYVDHAGPDDLLTASALNNLAPVYREASRWRQALEAAVRAVRIRSRALGYEQTTATSVQNLGLTLSGLGLVEEAARCYFTTAAIFDATFGAGHPRAARARHNVELLRAAIDGDRRFTSRTFAAPPRNLEDAIAALERILSTCERMLAEETDAVAFALKFGQVAHAESYVNRIFDIRRAQKRLAEPASVPVRVDLLGMAQTRVLDATGAPRVRLDAVLKRVDPAALGPKARATLACAFPNFEGGISRKEARDEAFRRFGIDEVAGGTFTDQKRTYAEKHGYGVRLVDQQFRRYSGEGNLPRGRYFTVCADASGNDGQTLCRELFEYADRRIPGFVFVSDSHDAELMAAIEALGFRRANPTLQFLIVMVLAPPDDGEREAFRHFLGPVLTTLYGPFDAAPDRWHGLSLIVIPTMSAPVALDGVIDLRQRAAQSWLFRFFREGDGAVSVRSPGRPIADFTGMLPSLLHPEYGGSGFTKSLGSWMRVTGVQGLVFPSARSDVSVTMPDDTSIADFHGWNFVDYRDVDLVPDMQFHVEDNPWYAFVPVSGVTPTLTVTPTSWSVAGIETGWRETRRLMLALLQR
jgi:tetratricopeptide (TPR) repeat protein